MVHDDVFNIIFVYKYGASIEIDYTIITIPTDCRGELIKIYNLVAIVIIAIIIIIIITTVVVTKAAGRDRSQNVRAAGALRDYSGIRFGTPFRGLGLGFIVWWSILNLPPNYEPPNSENPELRYTRAYLMS